MASASGSKSRRSDRYCLHCSSGSSFSLMLWPRDRVCDSIGRRPPTTARSAFDRLRLYGRVIGPIVAALALWVGPALPQVVDTTLWVTEGTVHAVVREASTIYIGGSFSSVGPATGGGVPLAAADAGLVHPFPKVTGSVYAVAPDGSGGWYIGGQFSSVGGLTRSNLARIHADGSVADWNPNADEFVYALAVNGGTVFVGGAFSTVGGEARSFIAALDATTGSATGWNPDADNWVEALALGADVLYAGGTFTTIGGQARHGLAALDVVTGSASAWDPSPFGDGEVWALAVSGTTVYASGAFVTIGGQPRNNIAALDATTGAATAWNANLSGSFGVTALAASGGTLYVGGQFTQIGGQARTNIAELDGTTGAATAWDPNAVGDVHALAVNGNLVYVAGGFTTIGGQARNRIAALDATTGLATAWNPNMNGAVSTLGVSGGMVYAGGFFTMVGGQARANIAALDVTSGTATAWNPGANGSVRTLAVSGNTVYAGGYFTTIGGQDRNLIAALDATTGAATDWNPSASGGSQPHVSDLAVRGGTAYVGGAFTVIGGLARNHIAALDVGTGDATAWNPDANGPVNTMGLSGGTVYAGGTFTTIGGQGRIGIAALEVTDGTATTWNPSAGGTAAWVQALAVNGGVVYAGGAFTTMGGQERRGIAALDAVTGAATAWNPGAGGTVPWVYSLAVSGSTVYAGGVFDSIGGQERSGLAALDVAAGNATAWNPSPQSSGHVFALALDGSTVYAGGNFRVIGGQPQSGLAAISDDTSTPVLVSVASAQGFPDRVELMWEVGDNSVGAVAIYRAENAGEWRSLGLRMLDGARRASFIDRDVEPGRHYGYRIGFFEGGEEVFAGETWVEVPAWTLALQGSRPNPSGSRLSVSFSLPVLAPATLELLDVTGRRLRARAVGTLGAGRHVVDMTPERPLGTGVYWLRLTQAGKALTAKTIVLE